MKKSILFLIFFAACRNGSGIIVHEGRCWSFHDATLQEGSGAVFVYGQTGFYGARYAFAESASREDMMLTASRLGVSLDECLEIKKP